MENASKALLIAGAILIVILLIAVGMLVYSQAKGTIDTGVSQMNSAEIQMFNAQFEHYEGEQDLASTKILLQTIINNNVTYLDDKSKFVEVYYKRNQHIIYEAKYDSHTFGNTTNGGHLTSYSVHIMRDWILKDIISHGGNYKVSLEYGDTGLVSRISIIKI